MKTAKVRKYPYSSVFANIFTEYVELNQAVGKKFDVDSPATTCSASWCICVNRMSNIFV